MSPEVLPKANSVTNISKSANGKHLPPKPAPPLEVYTVPVHMEESTQVTSRRIISEWLSLPSCNTWGSSLSHKAFTTGSWAAFALLLLLALPMRNWDPPTHTLPAPCRPPKPLCFSPKSYNTPGVPGQTRAPWNLFLPGSASPSSVWFGIEASDTPEGIRLTTP